MYLYKCLLKQFEEKRPFVVYRKPNADQMVGLFQKTRELHLIENFDEVGFVLAPFAQGKRFYIPLSESAIIVEQAPQGKLDLEDVELNYNDAIAKENFEDLVKRCVSAIKQNVFGKVVPSRKESIQVDVQGDLEGLFNRLCLSYPTAFCYVIYHPEIGMWAGATPESLLKVKDGVLETMALAGTQVNNGQQDVVWEQKEKEEQQFVTDFIVESLNPLANKITVSEPFTKRAARVMHICTSVVAELKENNVKVIVDALHPTPAVCGMPKAKAREFLINEEGYERKYYAGYIGELNCNVIEQTVEETDLYVNLRCMEVECDKVSLYIGCGVTKDSDPTSEFIETVNKSSTMKKVLK
ncbi:MULTISPECIES: chorismate-binding protein [Myroides]|uniref:isochorismate synthase n=1 Tax=Myroides albus TaxID=2562892 RepID=A0A6I3LLE9_9FLAO|nr:MULTISPECIES: chorismate-binding protein [Myroides]MTG98336.1 isochorismate synthase [Myroides albus]MVX36079.1 isochorismate synthase [Myroides sp. LoEW2-1]UVD79591.1 chorismate-binding protein [Myroides albus]